MERGSRKRSSSARSEKMVRVSDREEKMAGYCSTDQSPQLAVVPMEEEEEEEDEEEEGEEVVIIVVVVVVVVVVLWEITEVLCGHSDRRFLFIHLRQNTGSQDFSNFGIICQAKKSAELRENNVFFTFLTENV
jgi:hypothetical protein